jgi:transcriptional regulator with XRE-family HTH domain
MSPARLKEVMQILGLTRHDLAAAAGIKVGLVRDWLSGRRDVWPYIGQVLETDVKTVCVD